MSVTGLETFSLSYKVCSLACPWIFLLIISDISLRLSFLSSWRFISSICRYFALYLFLLLLFQHDPVFLCYKCYVLIWCSCWVCLIIESFFLLLFFSSMTLVFCVTNFMYLFNAHAGSVFRLNGHYLLLFQEKPWQNTSWFSAFFSTVNMWNASFAELGKCIKYGLQLNLLVLIL